MILLLLIQLYRNRTQNRKYFYMDKGDEGDKKIRMKECEMLIFLNSKALVPDLSSVSPSSLLNRKMLQCAE